MAQQPHATTTLRRFLTQNKPFTTCSARSQQHPTNTKWPTFEDPVTIWDAFTLGNLDRQFGALLDIPIPSDRLPIAVEAPEDLPITNSKSIGHLVARNDAMMQASLNVAKSHLQLFPGIVLRFRYNDVDQTQLPKLFDGRKTLRPDHIIQLDRFPASILVVGLARPSSHWSARRAVSSLGDLDKGGLQPLRELANLCKIAGTEFGYIQTDEDMVVCRFTLASGNKWKASIKPIPWSTYETSNLTADLALWWLCMRAMSMLGNQQG
ncbi:uncharacterized protein E0L32_007526 [Thyridium curvatum]|uniref:Uncharacterized protein n=1 Tax=Thyridium curvatum TaxID=1093900 RepID=A0A507B3B2_9PEZI|nr:uncharacterized protein E0L32_007526 [Thyridium curvatum]TPX11789.1 hypothetical protein E0L32_007526 [Thyridium curvatum]